VVEVRERVERYIASVARALRQVRLDELDEDARRVVRLAESYLHDSEYYLERGDLATSLACISYSEGLLDALRILGLVEFEWPKRPPVEEKRVLVGGVFDLLHPGHVHFLRKARELGRVVVVVARDGNVERLKGRPPVVPEEQRLEVVKSLRYVSEAYLGERELDVEAVVEKYEPDIIVLGPDQDSIEELVRRVAEKRGIEVVKLEERNRRFPLESSSEIISRVLRLFSKQAHRIGE